MNLKYMMVPAALALATCVSGCSLIQNDASVCSSKETTSEIFDLIKKSETESIQAIIGPNPDGLSKVNSSVDSLIASGNISLINITFQGIDKATHKISCQGNIHFNYTDQQKSALNHLYNPPNQNDIPISFFRQPSADGKSFIFSFQDPSNFSAQVGFAGFLQLMGSKKSAPDSNQNQNSPAASTGANNAVAPESSPPPDAS